MQYSCTSQILGKWNYTVGAIFRLGSFAQHIYFEIDPKILNRPFYYVSIKLIPHLNRRHLRCKQAKVECFSTKRFTQEAAYMGKLSVFS